MGQLTLRMTDLVVHRKAVVFRIDYVRMMMQTCLIILVVDVDGFLHHFGYGGFVQSKKLPYSESISGATNFASESVASTLGVTSFVPKTCKLNERMYVQART